MLYRRKDSPYWWISYRTSSGKKTCESSGATNHAEAKALEEHRRVESRKARAWGVQSEKTFDEVVLAYVETHQHLASADRFPYALKHLYSEFTGFSVNGMTAAHIRGYIEQRQQTGAGNDTIRRELGLLSAACNWCARELDWSIKNPVSGRLPPPGKGRTRWIKREEAQKLIQAAKESTAADYLPDFIKLALHTGMRRGEMLGLEWNRVDFSQGNIYLDAEHQKNRKLGSIPLNSEAMHALKRRHEWCQTHCAGAAWVFSHKDGTRIQSVKKSFKTACEKAGIKDFRIHDLRHTCAAWLVQKGVSIAQVSELLRHSDIRITSRYAHLAPHNIRSAVEQLE